MIVERTNDGDITVNGRTFFSFCNELRGMKIYSKHNHPIAKYLLYWKGLTPEEVKINYNIQYV